MQINFGIATLASSQHTENEDAAEVISGNTAILADGMGGEINPALASHIAVETIKKELTSIPLDASPEQNKKFFIKAICKANKELLEKVLGGGSTVSIVKIMLNKLQRPIFVCANTGDSRICIFRESLEQPRLINITEDQGLLRACYENPNLARRYGLNPLTLSRYQDIQKKLNEVMDISALDTEEKIYFDHRNIIFGGVGVSGTPMVDAGIGDIEAGDKIILMSDGVHDNLTTQQIELIMLETKDQMPEDQVKLLVQRAKEIFEKQESNGRGKPDDITAVVLNFQ